MCDACLPVEHTKCSSGSEYARTARASRRPHWSIGRRMWPLTDNSSRHVWKEGYCLWERPPHNLIDIYQHFGQNAASIFRVEEYVEGAKNVRIAEKRSGVSRRFRGTCGLSSRQNIKVRENRVDIVRGSTAYGRSERPRWLHSQYRFV
jgi:hypothetical protein